MVKTPDPRNMHTKYEYKVPCSNKKLWARLKVCGQTHNRADLKQYGPGHMTWRHTCFLSYENGYMALVYRNLCKCIKILYKKRVKLKMSLKGNAMAGHKGQMVEH